MTKIEPNKAAAFIVVFSVIALLINVTRPHIFSSQNVPSQQQISAIPQPQAEIDQRAIAQKAAQEATDRANFLARYLKGGFSKTPGSASVALVTATTDGKMDQIISAALATHFKSDTVSISTSFFKPEFVSDDLFGSVFDGSAEVLNRLELGKSLDALLLARETIKFSRNPTALDNVLTANVQLQVQVVPIGGNVKSKSWTFIANGAGFSQSEAFQMAEERLIKQITDDTKMSLSFSPNQN